MGRKKGKKGRSARNAQASQSQDWRDESYLKVPHSFVFHRGHVGKTVKELVLDVRKLMEPYTASSLRVRKKNVMKDFLTIAGPLHVTHFIVFTKTDLATYMKLICVPRGPTLTFRVNEFTLARDVLSFQKHPDVDSRLFVNHAVMVTNLPTEKMQDRLMNITFKNMFPSINPNTVKLNSMRRTVLINFNAENNSLDLRHYTMKVIPTGISRAMKKLLKSKLPDLGNREDIADLFLDKGMSDSEGEQDGPHSQVEVTQKVKDRGVTKGAVNAIRLKEIGPRLNLTLVKIEEGFEDGNVMFHSFVKKTPEEIEALKLLRQKKQKEKAARKQSQEANVQKKQEKKQEHLKKSIEGMKKKKMEVDENGEQETQLNAADAGDSNSEDDDAEHFRQEVGEEPEPEMFSRSAKRKRSADTDTVQKPKRFKGGATDKKKDKETRRAGKGKSKFSFKVQDKAIGEKSNKSAGGKNKGKSGKKFKSQKVARRR